MNVGEICSRTTVICGRNSSVLEASQLMRTSHVGDVIVTDERGGVRFPVGIVTDRDIVVGVVAKQVDPALVNVGEVMGSELVTALESEDLLEAIRRMRGKGVRRLPIVNSVGALVGLLAMDDVLEILAEQMGEVAKLLATERSREQRVRR